MGKNKYSNIQYQQKIINAQNKHYVMNLRNIKNLKTYERPMKNDFDVILIITYCGKYNIRYWL